MEKNTKDEIKFHILFNSVRVYKNVPLKVACNGLCSDSMMNYIENGKRLPDYRMRNRIMARLGVSSEEYEDFVQYDEYERWVKCQELIDYVERKDKFGSEKILKELMEDADAENKIEYQFLLDMKARIMELNECAWNEIADIYEKAVTLTMPHMADIDWDCHIFAPEEYYILLRYLYAKEKYISAIEKIYLCRHYEKICESIQRNLKQAYARAKVYPMAVCGWGKAINDLKDVTDDILINIWEHSSIALDSLRNAGRSYYLGDILQLRKQLRKILHKNYLKIREDDLEKEEQNWIKSFCDLDNKYAVGVDINFSGYIYISSEVYCIPDIITSRRRIYGISQKELAEGICTERTIIRIEKKQVKPQQYVVESLFRKLGVTSDYIRAEILTNDYSVVEIYSDYKHAMNDANYKRADEIEKKLHNVLDFRYPENRQVMANIANNRKFRTGEIDKLRYLHNMEKIIEMTMPRNPKCLPEDYVSVMEITILKNMAFGADVQDYQNSLISKCEKYYKKHMKNHASLYEFIMGTVASRLGDKKQYTESNHISKFIIEQALWQHRVHAIHRNMFNIAWNKAKSRDEYYEKSIYDALNYCASLSSFCKDYKTEMFYNKKIALFIKNEDWTM